MLGIFFFQIRSRSLIMCHHFVVGLGFLAGPVLLRPFLPEGASDEQREQACHRGALADNDGGDGGDGDNATQMANMTWPFLLVSLGHVACGLAYLVLIRMPWPMPVFSESQPQGARPESSASGPRSRRDLAAKATIVAFYFVSCGSERLFQVIWKT